MWCWNGHLGGRGRIPDNQDRSRYPRPYLLHQTPLHSESRRSALGARFGSLQSALSGKGTHRGISECLRTVKHDPGSKGVRRSYGKAGGEGFTYIQDGSSTVSTTWRKQMVVVLGAVGQTTALKERTGANLFFAVTTDEVLWMPCLP